MILEMLLTNDSTLITVICIVCAIPVTLFILEWIKRSIYRIRWNWKHRNDRIDREELIDLLLKVFLK